MTPYRLFTTLVVFAAASPVGAALMPTEIHYNGPAAGADPDEFVELANTGNSPLALEGYQFTAGLGLSFPDLQLWPGDTLIVAPKAQDFLDSFSGFSGVVLDSSGSLSNAGELLTLLDDAGSTVFSFSYDDGGAWPRSPDGAGDSLQLLPGALDPADPASWEAGVPTPGFWSGSTQIGGGGIDDGPATVPNPASLWLVAAGLLLLRFRRRLTGGRYRAPQHTIATT